MGVDGLRVANNSIFPRITNGNLSAPTIMIGKRWRLTSSTASRYCLRTCNRGSTRADEHPTAKTIGANHT
ncbi:MAG: hypothetical protein ACI9DC_000654 [Gammaproteobacteria bacterium]|jgi:hypothetical protein